MTTLYGIKNCDTVRKARRWLKEQDIDYHFHDLRDDGLDGKLLDSWLTQLDRALLLNRRGTTWRNLPATVRDSLDDGSARQLMLEHPALVKRPVLDHRQQFHLGFSPERYTEIFRQDTAR